MKWTLKSKIQNIIALLPSSISYKLYYLLQRKLGGLKKINPISRLQAGIEVGIQLKNQDKITTGKTFLEVGTGWRLNVPLALWLIGAKKIITVDLNPYLKEDLIKEDMDYIRANQEEIKHLFDGLDFDETRFRSLMDLTGRDWHLTELFELCDIQYISPGDATKLTLSENTIDYHISYTVLEHIPPDTILALFEEGNRIIKEDGLFIHRVDYSDHFSHSDTSINAINFLQYGEGQWDKLAGNRYMYMNRLRHDDFLDLYKQANHNILTVNTDQEPGIAQSLETGTMDIDDRFKNKPNDILAITGAWIVTEIKKIEIGNR
jgi:SAM-dependent methyltransferase